MATTASRALESPDPEEEELDTEITSIRAETPPQTTQTSIHHNKPNRPPHDNLPLVHAAGAHSSSNHHRIAFGATAFPFKDPSPTAPTTPLLGVRVDICARNGRFAKPHYVLLQSEWSRAPGANSSSTKLLKVYRHTVPAFISIAKLESVYLPRPGAKRDNENEDRDGHSSAEDEAEPAKPWKSGSRARKQDLRGFVRELRRELVAWYMRVDAVEFLREKLGFVSEGGGTRYVRVEWVDGRVGRFKLSDVGVVERAVVIGDEGRDKKIEDAMTGGGGRVETVLDRLRVDALSTSQQP
ncbi:Centromere protein Cenp-O [Penicillium coprophilum]|uniref:Centromere protein Cenp-O n=1 Tax=Penicillium coprophilum TaxID=36646 RepID=UPI0023A6331E|nr:Centromere protein Cenp-O [Penicillium coprophilum]KAJ5154635.1 Centromere protein Cenp-O [Penicillium coprophilum]